jgi:hypothetical protein
MAMTLQQIREYVWSHMDMDSTELPSSLLDVWAREATTRIVTARVRWPFLEQDWTVPTVANQRDYSLTALVPTPDEITSVVVPLRRLNWIGRDEAEGAYLPSRTAIGPALFFSTWNNILRIYPMPNGTEVMSLRGYRKVIDWVSQGAGAVPDLPDEFHDLVRIWVLMSAYGQQEDQQLMGVYSQEFQQGLARLVKTVGNTPLAFPLIIGGNTANRVPGRLSFPFETN